MTSNPERIWCSEKAAAATVSPTGLTNSETNQNIDAPEYIPCGSTYRLELRRVEFAAQSRVCRPGWL